MITNYIIIKRHFSIVSIHTHVILLTSCVIFLFYREKIQIGRTPAANFIHIDWDALFRVAWRKSRGESNRHA